MSGSPKSFKSHSVVSETTYFEIRSPNDVGPHEAWLRTVGRKLTNSERTSQFKEIFGLHTDISLFDIPKKPERDLSSSQRCSLIQRCSIECPIPPQITPKVMKRKLEEAYKSGAKDMRDAHQLALDTASPLLRELAGNNMTFKKQKIVLKHVNNGIPKVAKIRLAVLPNIDRVNELRRQILESKATLYAPNSSVIRESRG